jgi:hypothetical protein
MIFEMAPTQKGRSAVEYVLILVIAVLIVTTLMFLPVPRSESPTGMSVGNIANRPATVKPKYTCTDTDGGINVGEKGTAAGLSLGKKFSKTDYCIDNGTVKEYACNKEGRLRDFAMKCEGGSVCEGGECVSNLTCVDGDGGRDYFVKGKTSGYPRLEIEHQGDVYGLGDYVELEDYCYTNDTAAESGEYLREYFCKGDRVVYYGKKCKYGCVNGTCIEKGAFKYVGDYLELVLGKSEVTELIRQVEFLEGEMTQTIELKKGLNLVSLQYKPVSNNVNDIFKGQLTGGPSAAAADVIWKLVPGEGNYEYDSAWKVNWPDAGELHGNFMGSDSGRLSTMTLDVGEGFFIDSLSGGEVTVTGGEVSEVTLDIHKGHNHIGIPFEGYTTKSVLEKTGCKEIRRWDTGEKEWITYPESEEYSTEYNEKYDINGDGRVDGLDGISVSTCSLGEQGRCDANRDGSITIEDSKLILEHKGATSYAYDVDQSGYVDDLDAESVAACAAGKCDVNGDQKITTEDGRIIFANEQHTILDFNIVPGQGYLVECDTVAKATIGLKVCTEGVKLYNEVTKEWDMYCCGVTDGVCPIEFERGPTGARVSCSTNDPDC